MKLRTIIRHVLLLFAILGFLLFLGSIGAIENDSITLHQFFVRSAIGLSTVVLCSFGLEVI